MIARLRGILGVSGRVRRYLAFAALYALAEGVGLGLLVPLLTALLDGRTGDAARWLIPLAAAVAVAWAAQFRVGLLALRVASEWRRVLSAKVGRQLVQVPIGFFDRDRTGSIPQLVAGDVGRVAGLAHLAPALISAVATPVTVGVFLLAYDWRIALAGFAAVPVIVVVFALARRITDRTEAEHDAATADAGARLVEFAGAQGLLRATGRSGAGRTTLDEALSAQHRAARRQVVGALPVHYLGQLTVQLGFTGVLLVGVALATTDTVRPALAMALVAVGISFLRPFEVVAGAATSLRAARASLERIATLLAVAPLPPPTDPRPLESTSLSFADVHFGYEPGTPVLRGFTLDVPAGATTALVGVSGSGKTTVTKLAARFFDVDAGSVRIGGVDVRDLAADDLQGAVSIVFQDVRLLDASIADNIRVGRPDATDADIRDAARRAQALPIVERLAGGWDAPVGEGGRLLSGGERQRVAIARALCKDAPIVLLDEATSALDAHNEALVQQALAELSVGRTLLVIAHQLTTIAQADTIAVLDAGRVVEQGPHDELLARGGRYAWLWRERARAAGWRLA